jgi:tetratricopeptide (TPR) repeat protein
MSRFDNLEFGGPARARQRGAGQERAGMPVRDAAHFRQAAGEAYRSGRLEPALRSYSRALACDAGLCDCWLMQVRILIELEEYKEAGVWADKALEMFPDRPDLLAAKAVVSARTGLLDQAMAFSDNAMSRKGCGPYVWLARGEVLLARRSRMATGCLDRAVAESASAADKAWMHLEVARVLRSYGRCSEALFHATAAQSALPRYAPVALEVGACREALGLPEADTAYQEALHLDPRCEQAREGLMRAQNPGIRGYFKRLFGRNRHGT